MWEEQNKNYSLKWRWSPEPQGEVGARGSPDAPPEPRTAMGILWVSRLGTILTTVPQTQSYSQGHCVPTT